VRHLAPLITLGAGALVAGGLLVANEINADRAADAVLAAAESTIPQAATTADPGGTTSPLPATPAPPGTATTGTASSRTAATRTAATRTAATRTAATRTAATRTATTTSGTPGIEWTYRGPVDGTDLSAAISITGTDAVAYVCDGEDVEFWLSGTATDGIVTLTGPDGSSMTGGFDADLVGGVLTTASGRWTVSAPSAPWPHWAPPVTAGIGGEGA
jgi:serine/threonine-protein kinase